MTIIKEYAFEDFEPWGGAFYAWNRIKAEGKLGTLECILEDLYPEGMDETELNDMLWFDDETVFEWLGMETESTLKYKINEKTEELDSLLEEWTEIVQNEDYSEDERQKMWNEDYKDDVEDLRSEIKELEEQLADL